MLKKGITAKADSEPLKRSNRISIVRANLSKERLDADDSPFHQAGAKEGSRTSLCDLDCPQSQGVAYH
jgi:hypothetical protein